MRWWVVIRLFLHRATISHSPFSIFPTTGGDALRMCGCGLVGWIRGIKGYRVSSYSKHQQAEVA